MDALNPNEQAIYDYMKRSRNSFVSVADISRNVGNRKWFNADRHWARPLLRRLEMEGWVESNPFGEYRLKKRAEDTTTFRQALKLPGRNLGDTTIIFTDETDILPDAPGTDQQLKEGTA